MWLLLKNFLKRCKLIVANGTWDAVTSASLLVRYLDFDKHNVSIPHPEVVRQIEMDSLFLIDINPFRRYRIISECWDIDARYEDVKLYQLTPSSKPKLVATAKSYSISNVLVKELDLSINKEEQAWIRLLELYYLKTIFNVSNATVEPLVKAYNWIKSDTKTRYTIFDYLVENDWDSLFKFIDDMAKQYDRWKETVKERLLERATADAYFGYGNIICTYYRSDLDEERRLAVDVVRELPFDGYILGKHNGEGIISLMVHHRKIANEFIEGVITALKNMGLKGFEVKRDVRQFAGIVFSMPQEYEILEEIMFYLQVKPLSLFGGLGCVVN